MAGDGFHWNSSGLNTPVYAVSETLLRRNLEILSSVRKRTGCRILLALKAFSMFSVFPIVREYLDGVCASGLHEARLGREEFGREVHTFCTAFKDEEFNETRSFSDTIVFNSVGQYERFRDRCGGTEIGVRVNPGYSEIKTPLYDPCRENSRLGIAAEEFRRNFGKLDGISGIHFHAMCEQNADTLKRILEKLEKDFGEYLYSLSWVNLGGGHHITREDYDIDLLCDLVTGFSSMYGVDVILEPGEAVALNAGFLVASVIDIVGTEKKTAVLDTSAEAHMPDVLAMPYRPEVRGAGKPGEKKYGYILGGMTCLAGDIIGEYSFDRELRIGDRLEFTDMAIYTMVKNTTFNGINLPSICVIRENGKVDTVREFGYEDFRNRLS